MQRVLLGYPVELTGALWIRDIQLNKKQWSKVLKVGFKCKKSYKVMAIEKKILIK